MGAWEVDQAVYDLVPELIAGQTKLDGENGFACEVWVMDVEGRRSGDIGPITLDAPRIRVFPGGKGVGPRVPSGTLHPTTQHEWSYPLTDLFAETERLLPRYVPAELRDGLRILCPARFARHIFRYYPWGLTAIVRFEASEIDVTPHMVRNPSFQLCLSKRKDLSDVVARRVKAKWNSILGELGCRREDLREDGGRFPIMQYNVDWSSAEAIARGFGRFVSAVYPVVKDYVW